MQTIRPTDNRKPCVNPAMGWTMHFYSNVPSNYGSQLEPSDTLDDFPGLSTVYLRIPWAFMEPQEGLFNWSILDTPAQRWIAKGKKIALRLTTSENWVRFATPEWVFKAGAKAVPCTFGKGPDPNGSFVDPVFDDPIYLKKLETFLMAAGARYGNNPSVEFIDVGTFGMWGEGHTFMSSQFPEKRHMSCLKKHIALHKKAFPGIQLVISDDVAGPQTPGSHLPETDYSLSQGVGLRDDSILVQPPPNSWYHAPMAQAFWPKFPVVIEHEHYGGSKDRGAWSKKLLLKSVEDYHGSFMSIHWWPRILLEENRDIIERINLRLGYRLQLRKLQLPESVVIGEWFQVESSWANAGVAPCYPGGFMALTLKDEKGGIVSVMVDEGLDMRSLTVAAPDRAAEVSHQARFTVGLIAPTTKAGTYSLWVSVGHRDGTPVMELPLDGSDGAKRYRIGELQLTGTQKGW